MPIESSKRTQMEDNHLGDIEVEGGERYLNR
jgi:hypothetical protein